MSQENVKALRRLYEAFNRRDVDGLVELLHPEVELSPPVVGLAVRSHYRGREEAKEFFETISDIWETQTIEPKELVETPDGRVLAVENLRVRGREGIELDTVITDVYEFRGGLCVRIEGFRVKSEALEAVGLSE